MDPIWSFARHPYPVSDLPATAEVVVIGGGLTGTLTALRLAESGRQPLIVERRTIGAGASGRNAGLLLPGTSEMYDELASRWGREQARDLWESMEWGAAQLLETIEAHEIECQWRPDGAFHAAVTEQQAADLGKATVMLIADGFRATWIEAPDLSEWLGPLVGRENGLGSLAGALYQPHGGCLHSGLLASGLARAATRKGARITEEVEVTAVDEDEHGARVITSKGIISTDAVIIATNAWNAHAASHEPVEDDPEAPLPQLPEDPDGGSGSAASLELERTSRRSIISPKLARHVAPVRGQVLSTRPLATQVKGAWSLNRGYEYLQQLPDRRLVVGGMRWLADDMETGIFREGLNPVIQARLERWVGRWAEPSDTPLVELRWSGLMAWTRDRLPLIGPLPGYTRVGCGVGYSGHGVPAAPLAAAILTAWLNELPHPPAASMFDPRRRTPPDAWE